MASRGLVLSLFPGIGMLDMAFEEAGFCVVRGPDLLWGGDIHRFDPPAGRFDGVIGGPPCQFASEMSRLNCAMGKQLAINEIPEFERCVAAANPAWFVMENVVTAPLPVVAGYTVSDEVSRDHWCGGLTMRKRRFSFGSRGALRFRLVGAALQVTQPALAVVSSARAGHIRKVVSGKERLCSTGGPRMPIAEMARLQGLPPSFFGDRSPFTVEAQRKMVGNGVPLAMGRAVAAAVVRALETGGSTTSARAA